MVANIDKTLALSNVYSNNGIGSQERIQAPKGQPKTNPIKPDSFIKKPVILTPYNDVEKLYQKLLEKVAPGVLLDAYLDKNAIVKMIANNPEIEGILEKHNVPLAINIDNVKSIKTEHL